VLNPERPRVTLSPQSPSFARNLNPLTLATRLWTARDLIAQFTWREIEGRYRSSLLGLAWSFINPLVLLLVYTFVFGVVLKQRWPGLASEGLAQFGLVLFAGLIAFGIFSECVGRAAGLIVSTPNYVKRVVFPLELLPVSVLGSALFHAAISLGVLLVAHVALGGLPRVTWLLIPLVLAPVVLLSLGLLWTLASLGVFIRDLPYSVALVVQILFFVTPIFYPIEAIPPPFRAVVSSNPLASVVEALRGAIFVGRVSAWPSLLASGVTGLLVMLIGYAWFMRTRRAFGDVI
jgi:homopolymeric O-antigen transport system permease protein